MLFHESQNLTRLTLEDEALLSSLKLSLLRAELFELQYCLGRLDLNLELLAIALTNSQLDLCFAVCHFDSTLF